MQQDVSPRSESASEYGRVATSKAHESQQYNETSLATNLEVTEEQLTTTTTTNNNVYQELVLSNESKQTDEPNYGQSSLATVMAVEEL